MFKFNPEHWGTSIAFPSEIADRHMKLASGASFKVLLYMLRNAQASSELSVIAEGTALTADACADALEYWVRAGIVLDTDADEKKPPVTAKPASPERDIRPLPVRKPTAGEIAKRISQNSDLAAMYNEAQRILGLTFGYDMQGILLMIHDHYGFTPETVLLLLQHCRMTGSSSAAAVKALAQDWAKKGITAFADAEGEIVKLNSAEAEAQSTISLLGLPAHRLSDNERKYYYTWVNTYGYKADVIAEAYIIAGSGSPETAPLSAVGKELRRFRESGVSTAEQAKARAPKKKAAPKKPDLPEGGNKMRRSKKLDQFAEPDEEEDE